VHTVDTLGAGDIFHGAFTLAITENQDVPDALCFASAAAALKCTRFGGAFACPQRPEVEALLEDEPGRLRSYDHAIIGLDIEEFSLYEVVSTS